MFIISDEEGFILDHNGYFSHPELIEAKLFNSIEEARAHIYENFDKNSDGLYVEEYA